LLAHLQTLKKENPATAKARAPFAMPAQKRATTPPQFHELLEALPCPAWMEDSTGRILARNAQKVAGASCSRPEEQDARPFLKTAVYPLSPANNPKPLRLITLFPARQETDFQRRIISTLLTLLANPLQPRQAAPADVPSGAKSLTTLLPPRLREIHRELALGSSYKEIAATLGLSHENVRQHIIRLRRELGITQVPALRRKQKTSFT
jgi:DNA-binding CsgD family transcriptional regulator